MSSSYSINTKAFRKGMLDLIGEKFLTVNGNPTPLKRINDYDITDFNYCFAEDENNLPPFGRRVYMTELGSFVDDEFTTTLGNMFQYYTEIHGNVRFHRTADIGSNIIVAAAVYLKQDYNHNVFDVYSEMQIVDKLNLKLFTDSYYRRTSIAEFFDETFDPRLFVKDEGLAARIEHSKQYLMSCLPKSPKVEAFAGWFQIGREGIEDRFPSFLKKKADI